MAQVDWAEQVGKCFRQAARQYRSRGVPESIPEEESDESDREDMDEEIASAFSKSPDSKDSFVSGQFVSDIQRTFDDLVGRYAEKALDFPSSFVPPLVDSK